MTVGSRPICLLPYISSVYIWSQSTDSNHAALTYERLFNRPTRSYAMFAMFIIFLEQNL